MSAATLINAILPSRKVSLRRRQVDLPALLAKPFAHFRHALDRGGAAGGGGFGAGGLARGEEGIRRLVLLGGEVADFLSDLHRAELGAAHRAEVGGLGAFGGQRLVVVVLRRVGVERQVELVAPAELEARA